MMTAATCDSGRDTNDRKNAPVLNISAYKFVHLADLVALRREMKELTAEYRLKGTILLAPEGINLFVAGNPHDVYPFLDRLQAQERFSNLPIKESWSERQPFNRMLVRLKKEIIAFGVETIDPAVKTSRKITAEELKRWLDEGRELTLLDTRNDYEVDLGTFDGAIDLQIKNFKEFPQRVLDLPPEAREKPMVMFCTGGIRCEKAGPYVEQAGFREVYQLDGGILRYFEECGGSHYKGDCFVFDDRVAVRPTLDPSGAVLCYRCQRVLDQHDISSPKYQAGVSCPHCYRTDDEKRQQDFENRQKCFDAIAAELPGCKPYVNVRPIHIPGRLTGLSLAECLANLLPQVSVDYWRQCVADGLLRMRDFGKAKLRSAADIDVALSSEEVPSLDRVMTEGECVNHFIPDTIEPRVNANVKLLYQDEMLVVVEKPAGLPSHASGRFNKNTLEWIVNRVYDKEKIRLTHRLDANTSGVMVLVRRYAAARSINKQFDAGKIEKKYLARVFGHPAKDQFTCNARVSREANAEGIRTIDERDGLDALTEFRVIDRQDDGTALLEVIPKTGRTNQIRLHLWSMGFPVLNDPAYLPAGQLGSNRTLEVAESTMCLHASQITLQDPSTGEYRTWSASSPTWALGLA